MEQRFKSMSLFDFQRKFPDSDSCLSHLAELKWGDGYNCPKCGHGSSCEGSSPHSRQCTRCRYVESPTAGTLFHKLKFDPLKAFWIVYFLATNKKGFSSTELARKLELGQKTCWRFKRKVMKAMRSSGNYPITGTAEVDETVFGQQEEGVRGRQNAHKKLVVVGIEKKGKGVSRLYAREIPPRRRGVPRELHEVPHRSGDKGDHRPMDGLRAVGKGFCEHGTDPVRQEGEQLPGTAQGDHDAKGMAKGDAPPRGRPAGLSRRILL